MGRNGGVPERAGDRVRERERELETRLHLKISYTPSKRLHHKISSDL
jgi:hypothetical protein